MLNDIYTCDSGFVLQDLMKNCFPCKIVKYTKRNLYVRLVREDIRNQTFEDTGNCGYVSILSKGKHEFHIYFQPLAVNFYVLSCPILLLFAVGRRGNRDPFIRNIFALARQSKVTFTNTRIMHQ